MASSNPYLMTLPQLMSAKKKIGTVAAYHDPKKNSFAGFTGASLLLCSLLHTSFYPSPALPYDHCLYCAQPKR